MASATKRTRLKMKQKNAKRGSARKRKVRAYGTTPRFPIHLS